MNIEDAIGSSFDDIILGNELANVIRGSAGHDVIDGRGGDDTLFAMREGIVEFTRGLKRRVHVRPVEA